METFRQLFEADNKVNWNDDFYVDGLWDIARAASINNEEFSYSGKSDTFSMLLNQNYPEPKEFIDALKNNGVKYLGVKKGKGKEMDEYKFKITDKKKFDEIIKRFS
jgi:hypothetical protein